MFDMLGIHNVIWLKDSKSLFQHYLAMPNTWGLLMYKNNINATHPYPCGICKKNVNKNEKAITGYTLNVTVHL